MLVIPAILEKFSSLNDRTIKLVFQTNEPSPEQMTAIYSSIKCAGFLAFNKDAFRTEQLNIIEETKADYEDKTKTPSKRLRDVLFISWKQHNEGYDTYEDYYRHKMDIFINHVKSKLEP